MGGWLRWVALVLVVLAIGLGTRRVGLWGDAGGPVRHGPPVEGARGRLLYVREGDLWNYDLREGLEKRLTHGGGHSFPRWSASGLWFSFVRDGQLWVMRHDGRRAFAVPGGDVAESARWTYASARLAYVSQDGSLSTLDATAGPESRRIIVSPGSGAGPGIAWSADGSRIAFERHQPMGRASSNEGIWTIRANGRDSFPVYVASGDFHLSLCCWTHAGNYLLFWQGPSSVSRPADGLPLYVVRSSSSQPVPVGEVTSLRPSLFAAVPGTDAFVFVSGADREPGSSRRLLIAEPQTGPNGAVAVVSKALPLVDNAGVDAPAWAPRSPWLAIAVAQRAPGAGDAPGELKRRVWLAQVDGSGSHPLQQLLPDATVPTGVSDERPQWARDGKTLVFVRRLNSPRPDSISPSTTAGVEIWVSKQDGGLAKRAVGGLSEPPSRRESTVDWSELFDYYGG
jgi:hypothetical protein